MKSLSLDITANHELSAMSIHPRPARAGHPRQQGTLNGKLRVLRALNNTSSTHSGLDPESPKLLITLDTGLRRYDDIAGWAGFGTYEKAFCQ